MDLSGVSAGLAWAVPVKPDQLGAHLQAYKKILPTLTTLRLCHRFGKGESAHLTKLPLETINSIEALIFQPKHLRNFWEWGQSFRHYESKCQPLDHQSLETDYDVREEFMDHECSHCRDMMWSTVKRGRCTSGCKEKIDELANEYMNTESAFDWRNEDCENHRSAWEESINQRPNGNFVKYDELLRKHFGLEAFFAPTRKPAARDSQWSEHPNYKWHVDDELKTTICYLTLPGKTSAEQMFSPSEMEADCGSFVVEGVQSSFVDLSPTMNKDQRTRRFGRALRVLKLEPYIHPSQLNDSVNPESCRKEHDKKAPSEDQELSAGKAEMEWPQLVMLVKSVAVW